MRVVVVGSINVDLVVSVSRLPLAGETVAGGVFARHGGGKSANQAVAAARLGASVALVGAVGADEMGDAAVGELAAEGIDVSCVARVDAPTGVALIVVDDAGENQIAVASGANAALVGRRPSTSRGDGVVLLGHEVSAEVVLAAARAANEAGWPVVLNPAPARSLPDATLAVLTPNASEAAELTGCDDPADAARSLVAQTGAAVLITLGGDGALLLEPDGSPVRLPGGEGRRRRHHRRRRHRQRRPRGRARPRRPAPRRRALRPRRGRPLHHRRRRPRRHAVPRRRRGRPMTPPAPRARRRAAPDRARSPR